MPTSQKGLKAVAIVFAGGFALSGCAAPGQLDIATATATGSGLPIENAAPAQASIPAAMPDTSSATIAATQDLPMPSHTAQAVTPPPAAQPAPQAPVAAEPTPAAPSQNWATTVTPAAEPNTQVAAATPADTPAATAPAAIGVAPASTSQPAAAAAPAFVGTPPKPGTLAAEKPDSALRIARAAATSGDYAMAVGLYEQLAASPNASPDIFSELGDTLYSARAIDDAARAYGGALQKAPGHLGATVGMGKVAMAQNRPGDAKAYFERALAVDAGNRSALNGLAVANDALGDHRAAQEIYARALARYPNDPSLRSNYELSRTLSGQAPQAANAGPLAR